MDNVIIEEYSTMGQTAEIGTIPTTTQVLDIATLSDALAPTTKYIRIQSKDIGFWYKFGLASVSAAADTNGNLWLPANQCRVHEVGSGNYIDTAADA